MAPASQDRGMSSKDTLTVSYATADASSVGAFVSERYDLGDSRSARCSIAASPTLM